MKVMISISPRRIARVLTVVALGVSLASVIGQFSLLVSLDNLLLIEIRESFVRLFALAGEANIPAWYSSSVLLLCSLLLATLAILKEMNDDRYVLHWRAMSLIFLCLSIDEVAMIHEMVNKPLLFARNISGFFYYPWVIVAAGFVLVFVLAYLRFLADLPQKTRRLFVVAGSLFVGGVIAVEALSAQHASRHGTATVAYQMIITVEELLEMVGVIVFIYALLDYLRSYVTETSVQIEEKPAYPVFELTTVANSCRSGAAVPSGSQR